MADAEGESAGDAAPIPAVSQHHDPMLLQRLTAVEHDVMDLRRQQTLTRRDVHDLSTQREREHTENQGVLRQIQTTLATLVATASDGAARQTATRADVDDLLFWRRDLRNEIKGMMRIPKVLLASVPIAALLLGAVTVLHL